MRTVMKQTVLTLRQKKVFEKFLVASRLGHFRRTRDQRSGSAAKLDGWKLSPFFATGCVKANFQDKGKLFVDEVCLDKVY